MVIDVLKDEELKYQYIDSLKKSVNEDLQLKFEEDLNYFVDNKLHKFNEKIFLQKKDSDDDYYIVDLVLPTFKYVWIRIYQDIPEIFRNMDNSLFQNYMIYQKYEEINKRRMKLFQNFFNMDELSDELYSKYKNTQNVLDDFEFLDNGNEHFKLIADNYINKLIDKVFESINYKRDITKAKIKKII